MIRFAVDTDPDGRRLLFVGLTDVNVKRMIDDDDPQRVVVGRETDELFLFYANRGTLLWLADKFGIDEKLLLDQLGEG